MKNTQLFATLLALAIVSIPTQPLTAQPPAKKQFVGFHDKRCPVYLDSFNIDGHTLYFWYYNNTGKDVEGVMFDAAYFDASQAPHHIQVWGNYNDLIRPGKYKEGALNIKFLKDTGYEGLSLWPTKVRLKDGSTLDIESGAMSCGVEQHGSKMLLGTGPVGTGLALMAQTGR